MQKQYLSAKTLIQEYSARWEQILSLRWMNVEHVFLESYNDEDHHILADTSVAWQYRAATIRWYLPAIMTQSETQIDTAVAHEYVHVLLGPIESRVPGKYEEQKEFVVESIALSLQSALKATA
jgi:hypothetical protein